MLSSLRKKTEAAGPVAPAWHPNFRNFERLPDTKVVRTAFFINGAAISIAAVMLLYCAYQEFTRFTLAQQVADWEGRIEAARGPSAAAVAQFRKFQAEEKTLLEVAAFVDQPVVVSALILRLAETLPAEFTLEYCEYRATGVVLRGSVQGSPGEASGRASDYVAQLQADEQIGSRFETIALTSLSRDAASGQLNIEVLLKLPAKKS